MLLRQNHTNRPSSTRLAISQKGDLVRSLIKITEYGSSYNLVNTLFGYTLSSANIPLNDKVALQLKLKFNTMQDLFYDSLVSQESIALMVVDAIETKRTFEGDERQKMVNFMDTLTYSFQEIITNPHFIYEKWENQERIYQQNLRNEKELQRLLEEENRQLRAVKQAEAQGWECPVCCCDIDKTSFGILQCGHIFHPECINGYLKSKIQQSEVDMACPMEGCNRQLQVGDIYSYINGDLKQKYEKFSFNKFVEKNNSTGWCPTAGCTAVFEFEEELTYYRCPACKKHYCLKCKCLYHTNMTCAEHKVNSSFDKNDEEFIKFVRGAKYKQCPKCNFWVERNLGCSTMMCKCGQEFCYDCGGTTCPHGACANKAPTRPSPKVELPHVPGKKRRK